jgi:3-hydroxyisobutyrate dehydrogenase-like beta-hydroxyacid dehydrogenase
MKLKENKIGIIGLGQMGSGISANLVKAGYFVTGYDLKSEALVNLIRIGGKSAENVNDILEKCNVVVTCVEGKASIKLADNILIPNAKSGQIFIDHSTVAPPQTRRIGKAFIDKGCKYLDAPISGGSAGAETGTLRIFIGGDKSLADEFMPYFEVIGNPEKIVYCGKIGMGQIGKIVQQLTTRFPDVARLELMAFGLQAGLDEETLLHALDVSPDSNDPYARYYRAIKDGSIENVSLEYAEWGYYLEEVKALGISMPMLEAMFEFCKNGEKTVFDPLKRPEPSIWNELMKKDKQNAD